MDDERLPLRISVLGAIVLIALELGCTSRVQQSPVRPREEQAGALETSTITLRLVDRAEYESVLKSLRGKVVLVDFWATWCVPCVEFFPHTVEWAEKYADQGLVCVSVCFDDPDEDGSNPEALAFLQQHGANKLVNLLSRYGADAQSFEVFGIGGGGIPHYKLYDQSGHLIRTFGNEDPDHPLAREAIEAAIVEALKDAGES